MKIELGEKNATIFSLEAREKAVKEQLRATEEEFAAKTELLRDAEQALTDKQAELAQDQSRTDRPLDDGGQPPGRTGRGAHADRGVEEPRRRRREGICGDAGAPRPRSAPIPSSATRELVEARGRVENLSQRVTDLDRQLIVQVKEAEMLGNRVNDLEARLATQGKLLAEREYENNQLRAGQRSRRARRAANCATRSPATNGGKSPVVEKLRSREGRGRGTAARRPRRARQAAARHQRDPAAGRKLVGDRAHGKRAAARAHQRHRRRSRQARDAAGRPEFADRGDAGRRTAPPPKPRPSPPMTSPALPPSAEGGGTLAERIRALQSHASRARQQGA